MVARGVSPFGVAPRPAGGGLPLCDLDLGIILMADGDGRASDEGGVPQLATHGCRFSSLAASAPLLEHSNSCCTAKACTAAAAARAAFSVIASA